MPQRGNKRGLAGPYYIGLMSGTSTDGVDGVLASFHDPHRPAIVSAAAMPMPASLRAEFLALNHPGPNELERASLAGVQLAGLYAATVQQLLDRARMDARQVNAIGAHGQTVRHDPESGYTIQINAPAHLAERSGIAVIADFRSRDIAAGGQGAPLVPAFHRALFAKPHTRRAVVNLGGIANVTLLSPQGGLTGFDTGPANVLLDTWAHEKTGQDYDRDGQWAATGRVNPQLLNFLLESEPWLTRNPPKSTGRHLFNREWLLQRLDRFRTATPLADAGALQDADVQATLQAFTASTVANAIRRHAPDTDEVIVCGGGALNPGLMKMLTAELGCPVRTTDEFGIPVQQVEALAFAWLAYAWDHAIAAGVPDVTGARHPRVLGCKYPA